MLIRDILEESEKKFSEINDISEVEIQNYIKKLNI